MFNTLKTPSEFVDHCWTNMKTDLNKYDIQIEKLGLIGYLTNILGWTTYDLKNYYDSLYKEAFVATSREDHNLRLHASIYGYNPDFAFCSNAVGEFLFDFLSLPATPKDIVKREVIFSDIRFNINGYNFITDYQYRFIEESNGYYCMVYGDDNVHFIPSSTTKVKAPFYKVKQQTKIVKELVIQNYTFGTHCPFNLAMGGKYLSDLKVHVGYSGEIFNPQAQFNNFGTEFKIKTIKFLSGPDDDDVFIRKSGLFDYILEFGSGVKGSYVPTRNAAILIYTTDGFSGNISSLSNPIVDSCKIVFKLYKKDGTITTSSVNKNNLKINFEYSEGGKNPPSGDELRKSIINYIQTRDNFINEKDFYNICQKYMNDFRFLFRKNSFSENTFYLERCFRDKYQNLVYTTNITQELIKKINNDQNITLLLDTYENNIIDSDDNFVIETPEMYEFILKTTDEDLIIDNSSSFVYSTSTPISSDYIEDSFCVYRSDIEPVFGGNLPEGKYFYIVKASDNFKEYQIGVTLEVNIDGISSNAVKISWDPVPGAVKYIIYGRPNKHGYFQSWSTFENSFIDIGENGQIYMSNYGSEQLIFYPEYKIKNKEFVSPFVYEYDSMMSWYKSYLLYSNFLVYFDKIKDINSNFSVPIIFFNIVYDKRNYRTKIFIKSYQDISGYDLILTIQGLNILTPVTNNIDQNTWLYEYSDSNYSIIWNNISLELTVSINNMRLMTGQTSIFNQIHNTTDQLKLFTYENFTDGKSYITNVPIIDKELYYSDELYYSNKIYEFLFINDFQENRMITDEIQFRFINTFVLPSYFINKASVQKYNFELCLPLKLEVSAYIDQVYLENNQIDLTQEKNNLLDLLASELQNKYTGSTIKYYNSKIDEFIHTNRPYIKNVNITVTDSNKTIIQNGIEINDDKKVLDNITTDLSIHPSDRKLKILEYVPPFFYWDINNIVLQFLF